MTNNINYNTTATTPVETTTPVTETTPKTRVIGSMKVGVDTSDIKFKTFLELRREHGDNWM